jgi:hypothetical protein
MQLFTAIVFLAIQFTGPASEGQRWISLPVSPLLMDFRTPARVSSGSNTVSQDILPGSGSHGAGATEALVTAAAPASGARTEDIIRVTGIGMPPANTDNPTVRREMAERAALSDGRRKLVKAIAEIKVGPRQTLRSRLGEKKFTRKVEGFIKGYTVVGKRELEGGIIEIDLVLPLTGPGELSRHLSR